MNHRKLILGMAGDPTTEYLIEIARRTGSEIDLLLIDGCSDADEYEVSTEPNCPIIYGGGCEYDLSSYRLIFNRTWYRPVGDSKRDIKRALFVDRLHAHLNVLRSVVVNRPRTSVENGSKLLHMRRLAHYNLCVPDYFVTNIPSVADEAIVGGLMRFVSKGSSGVRTIVEPVGSDAIDQLWKIRRAPPVFQRSVTGREVRVHLVGDGFFCLAISSPIVDYRYAERRGFVNEYAATDIPSSLKSSILRYCQESGLIIAGVDLIQDADTSNFFVLEINPMPGFDFFDKHLGGSIAEALLRLDPDRLDLSFELEELRANADEEWGRFFIEERRRPAVRL